MYDKKAKNKEYVQTFKRDLKDICFSCKNFSKTIILVNVNSPYIKGIVLSELSSYNIKVETVTMDYVDSFGTLGGFLRYYNNSNSSEKKRTLILDFAYDFKNLSFDEAASIINTNRDLFTLSFDSVIILANQELISTLRYRAADFWSCVNIHMDTTKWYSTPITLPIVKIRINSNTIETVANLYKRNIQKYSSYLELDSEINSLKEFELDSEINGLKEFELERMQLLLDQIVCVPDGVMKISLVNTFTEKLVNIKTKPESMEKRLTILENLLSRVYNSLEYVDINFLCAELFFKNGKYAEAKTCYQKASQILENEWEDCQKPLIDYFLSCNIVICKYMQSHAHNPQNLYRELKARLAINESMMLESDLHLANNYLFLVYCAYRHHSVVEHRDMLEKLKINFACSSSMIDFSECYRIQLLWEEFIFNKFIPKKKYTRQPMYNMHLYIQQMVHSFMIGNYEHTRYAYKHAIWFAKNYGYVDVLNLIKVYYENIVFINEKFENR